MVDLSKYKTQQPTQSAGTGGLKGALANLRAGASAPEPEATKPAAAPAPTSSGSSLQERLAKLKGKTNSVQDRKLHITQQAVAAQKAEIERKQLQASNTEVPADILELNPAVAEIDGLQADQFSTSLAKLYQAVEADQPDIAKLLELINKNLRQYEELSYLLKPAQLSLIFKGTMKVTNTQIKTTAKKKSAVDINKQLAKEGGLDLSGLDSI